MSPRWTSVLALAAAFVTPTVARPQDSSGPVGDPPHAPAGEMDVERVHREVDEVFRRSEWAEVVRRAKPAIAGPINAEKGLWILVKVVIALNHLERHAECLAWADRFLARSKELPFPDHGATPIVENLRVRALLGLDRLAEARAACEELLRRDPRGARTAFALSALAAIRSTGRTRLDPRVPAKYLEDPRLHAALRGVEACLPRAAARLRERLRAPELHLPEVTLSLVAAEDCWLGGSMCALVFRIGERRVPVILVQAESLVTTGIDVEAFLAHELTHVLRDADGPLAKAPLWVEEGMAMWVQDPLGLWAIQRLQDFSRVASPEAVGTLAALAGEEAAARAPEGVAHGVGGLYFWDMERRRGTAVVRKAVLEILRGRDWREALQAVDGRPVDAALKDLKSRGPDLLRETTPGWDDLDTAIEHLKHGRNREGLAGTETFLAAHPDSPALDSAKHYRAYALFMLRRDEEARSAFEAFAREHPRSNWADEIAFWEIRLADRCGDHGRVVEKGEAFLRDRFSEDARWREVVTGILEKARARRQQR